jgi:hypothetical protein
LFSPYTALSTTSLKTLSFVSQEISCEFKKVLFAFVFIRAIFPSVVSGQSLPVEFEADIFRPEHHAKYQAHPVLPHVRLSGFPNLQNLGYRRRHNRVALPVNQRKFATMRND